MSSLRPSRLEELVETHIAAGNIDLPVFPSSAQEVLALCEAPDADAKKLSDVIRRDASLAGHFLAIANSAAYGGRGQLVTLQQALTRLGLAQTKQIAVVVACKTRAFVVPDRPERAAELLAHAFQTALFAQEIARARRLNVEEAFLAGLLHDIGEPAVLQVCAEVQTASGLAFDSATLDVCSHRFHERIGGLIARKWQMRAPVIEAICGHHAEAPKKLTTSIVQLADRLADGERDLARHAATDALNLYPDDLKRIVQKVEALSQGEAVAA